MTTVVEMTPYRSLLTPELLSIYQAAHDEAAVTTDEGINGSTLWSCRQGRIYVEFRRSEAEARDIVGRIAVAHHIHELWATAIEQDRYTLWTDRHFASGPRRTLHLPDGTDADEFSVVGMLCDIVAPEDWRVDRSTRVNVFGGKTVPVDYWDSGGWLLGSERVQRLALVPLQDLRHIERTIYRPWDNERANERATLVQHIRNLRITAPSLPYAAKAGWDLPGAEQANG